MPLRTALILGASGLTGNILLKKILDSNTYDKVYVYTRSSLNIIHPALEEKLVDFDTLHDAVPAEDVFCCLGTTIKKAGSQEAFKKVDYGYPLKVAQLQSAAGSKNFLVISAIGASSTSSIFYSRVKGAMEEAISALPFQQVYIFRPSFIAGKRKEKRLAEEIALPVLKLINPLFMGPLKKYRSVSAEAIANAMLYYAQHPETGVHVIPSDEILKFS